MLQHDVFPYIGAMPVSTIKPPDVLGVAQRVEARGAIDSAHRIKQLRSHPRRQHPATDLSRYLLKRGGTCGSA